MCMMKNSVEKKACKVAKSLEALGFCDTNYVNRESINLNRIGRTLDGQSHT